MNDHRANPAVIKEAIAPPSSVRSSVSTGTSICKPNLKTEPINTITPTIPAQTRLCLSSSSIDIIIWLVINDDELYKQP